MTDADANAGRLVWIRKEASGLGKNGHNLEREEATRIYNTWFGNPVRPNSITKASSQLSAQWKFEFGSADKRFHFCRGRRGGFFLNLSLLLRKDTAVARYVT